MLLSIREQKNDSEEEEYLQSDIPENVRRERILLIGGEISLRSMDNFFNITTAHCVVMAAVNLKE